jgi:hypothetical protein
VGLQQIYVVCHRKVKPNHLFIRTRPIPHGTLPPSRARAEPRVGSRAAAAGKTAVQLQETVRRRGLQLPPASTWGVGPPRAARAHAGSAVQPGRRGRGGCRRSVGAAPSASTRLGAGHPVAGLGRAPPRQLPRRRLRQGQHPHRALRAHDLAAACCRVRPVSRGIPARRARHLQQLRRSELVWPPPPVIVELGEKTVS